MIAIKTRSLYRRLRTGRKFTIFRQIVFTSATKKNQHPSPPGKGWFLCCFSQATWAAAQHCLGEVRKGSLLFPLWRKQYWQNVGNAVEDKVSLLFLLLPMHSFTAHSSKWVMLLVTIYTLCLRKTAWSKVAGLKTMAMPLSIGSSVWRVPGMGAHGRVAGMCHGGRFYLRAGWP